MKQTSKVKQYRERMGWTQRELAWVVGCGHRTVVRIENGEQDPTNSMSAKFEVALQMPREDLWPDLVFPEVEDRREEMIRRKAS